MKYFLAIFCSLSSFNVSAQVRTVLYNGIEEVVENNEMRILSWNIQMLPRILWSSRGPITRSKLIPRFLINDNIDIIVFQEAFDVKARRILKSLLEKTYPYIIGPANPTYLGNFKTNSGVMIFSKIPLKHIEEIDYKDCEHDNCLARKGALLVEGEWQGVPFQVLGTHLNSGGAEWIRQNQYHELRDLADRHKKEGVPQFLCGDFNTPKRNVTLYSDMVTTLGVNDGPLYSALQYTDDPIMNDMSTSPKTEADRDVIDFIFLRENGVQPASMERYVRQYQERWCSKYKDLSDHNAVLMRVKF